MNPFHALRDRRDPFWSKVKGSDMEECWIWAGSLSSSGYGQFSRPKGYSNAAHRYSYEQLRGEIPEGLQIDHLCRVRNCVNPWHLEPVTAQVNKQRAAAVITHCPVGHEYTDLNTKRDAHGYRSCRSCAAKRRHDRYNASKAAKA